MPDPASDANPAAILLAAGASTRLGQPKQLLRLGEESLLRRTTRFALEAGAAPVIAVLGYEAERMRAELSGLRVSIAGNAAWAEGMASSLRCGMRALASLQPDSGAVLLLVCDQPRLSLAHLQALLSRHAAGSAPVTASVYGGRPGVPAVFSRALFPELLAVEGDRGAREVIRRCGGSVQLLPWPDGALDLDTPEDLASLSAKEPASHKSPGQNSPKRVSW